MITNKGSFHNPNSRFLVSFNYVSGRGMNAAFAIGRLCDFEAGCKRMLSLKTSNMMVNIVADCILHLP